MLYKVTAGDQTRKFPTRRECKWWARGEGATEIHVYKLIRKRFVFRDCYARRRSRWRRVPLDTGAVGFLLGDVPAPRKRKRQGVTHFPEEPVPTPPRRKRPRYRWNALRVLDLEALADAVGMDGMERLYDRVWEEFDTAFDKERGDPRGRFYGNHTLLGDWERDGVHYHRWVVVGFRGTRKEAALAKKHFLVRNAPAMSLDTMNVWRRAAETVGDTWWWRASFPD